jgi:hypothetical protein
MYTCLEKGEELKGNYEGDEHTQRLTSIEFGHVQVLLKPKKISLLMGARDQI